MPKRWTRVAGAAVAATLTAATLTACSGGHAAAPPANPETSGPATAPSTTTRSSAAPSSTAPIVTVLPAPNTANVPVGAELAVTGAKVTAASLTDEDGNGVTGAPRPDGTGWVSDQPLQYATRYTASVTASGTTHRTSFTTMTRPGKVIGSGLYLFDGGVYGVGMPVVAEFWPGIPVQDHAAVQKRLFVTTVPSQPGTWYWLANGTQAFYRAKDFWRPGTTITVRLAIEGIPLSNGQHGNEDRRATAEIGDSFVMKVDNADKRMRVYENGILTRTMPVSLGKPSTPSSSGTMVIMEKHEKTKFDTRSDPNPENRYVIDIEKAQRLTWKGEFIHSAPWSVGDQGHRNVSHGCVNLSPENADWLFARTKIGDPITVTGTERRIVQGNGWTPWSLTWEEFVKGSALPS